MHSTDFLYNKIEQKINSLFVDTSSDEMILINKKRSYRDVEQFSDLIDTHISNNEHIKYINLEEKVYILYLYHFYYEVYK